MDNTGWGIRISYVLNEYKKKEHNYVGEKMIIFLKSTLNEVLFQWDLKIILENGSHC